MKKNLNLIVGSAELYKKLDEVRTLAINSIVNIMKSHNVESVDFMLDNECRDFNDEDYDEDWVDDNRVWVDCYSKYSNEVGYVSTVTIGKNDLMLTAEGENGTYENDYVGQNTGVYISVLERIETIFNNNK